METRTPPQPQSRRQFEVAIICALSIEADAVQGLFDCFWDEDGDLYGKAPGDQNSYTTGVIGNHNVVLAYMPGLGKGYAASVAANLRSSFGGIRLALVVGVCGGVPRGSNRDLFLGDIVISDEVVAYDFGRRLPNKFIRWDKTHSGVPNPEVRAFLAMIRSRIGQPRLKKKTSHHLDLLQLRTNDYEHPGQGKDKLFQPTYHHKHHGSSSCKRCARGGICKKARLLTCEDLQCDEGHLIVRSRSALPLGDNSKPLEIHFGRIASGDTVMKSGEDRDSIAQRESVIAFEMEGAGVLGNLPCIIVKGVCDYADSHKDKTWQKYAAGSAAACMKALLDQWAVTDYSSSDVNDGRYQIPPEVSSVKGESRFLFYSRNSQPGLLGPDRGLELSLRSKSPSSPSLSPSSKMDDLDYEVSYGDRAELQGNQSDCTSKLLQALPTVETDFKQALAALKVSRKHLPRDTDLRGILKTQRAMFGTILRNVLLMDNISLQETQNMAINKDHPMWSHGTLYSHLASHLAASTEACYEVIQNIKDKLVVVESLTRRLGVAAKRKMDDSRESPYNLLRTMVHDVKLHIQNLYFLISRNDRKPRVLQDSIIPASTLLHKELKPFLIVQQAASSLYDALESACSTHTLHDVHLSLQPESGHDTAQVRFQVALSSNSNEVKAPDRNIWLNVESTVRTTSIDLPVSLGQVEEPSCSPKRQFSEEEIAGDTSVANKRIKQVQFMPLASFPGPEPEPVNVALGASSSLCLDGDFCTILQELSTEQSTYVGVLGASEACKHKVYTARKVADAMETHTTTLSQMISRSRVDLVNGLSMYECIRLARYLATAVLYYHATPWLDKPWHSDNIYFLDSTSGNCLLQRTHIPPYFITSIPYTNRSRKRKYLSRNPVLFKLAVMFLELAYQAPFSALYDPHESQQDDSQLVLEYDTARRLADASNTKICAGFKQIIEKCLYCDFGEGNDFKSVALQHAFHRDIIGGLEYLEGVLRDL